VSTQKPEISGGKLGPNLQASLILGEKDTFMAELRTEMPVNIIAGFLGVARPSHSANRNLD
jgi:hypothetical protein